MNQKYRIILSGGGTGGHIYPAIAIANELKSAVTQNAEFLFVGAKDRMEMEKVPQAGYENKGFVDFRYPTQVNFEKSCMFPFKLLSSLFRMHDNISKKVQT